MTGIVILDKPGGLTSFSAVSAARKIFGEKKAGHTGTLDPMATGVLVLLFGGATRFAELLTRHDKSYRAGVRLGLTTDTLDITGKVLSTHEVNASQSDFEAALAGFVGEIEQIAPMYSAVMKDGVRLYELARKGVEVQREPRRVTVFSASLVSRGEEENEYIIDVHCSGGTYVRTLADDLGRVLGCGGVLTSLRRTEANGFGIEKSASLEKLREAASQGRLGEHLIPVEAAFAECPGVTVSGAQTVRFCNGGALDLMRLPDFSREPGLYRVLSPDGDFLGLGEVVSGAQELAVKRVFVGR